MFDYMI